MKKKVLLITLIIALAVTVFSFLFIFKDKVFKEKPKNMEEVKMERLKSAVDFNNNGKDDYEDFVVGARKDAEKKPVYDGSYFAGGYPPENKGVCTDLIWRAFKEAGYNLKDMVDEDINSDKERYGIDFIDNNIDFRRVYNLYIFFGKYGQKLTTDLSQVSEFQPGDILIFDRDNHIGIVSDKRNSKGEPYILHNEGQLEREEDYLKRNRNVTAHFRFDAEKIDGKYLKKWE